MTPVDVPLADVPTPVSTVPPEMATPLQQGSGKARLVNKTPVAALRTWTVGSKSWHENVMPPLTVVAAKERASGARPRILPDVASMAKKLGFTCMVTSPGLPGLHPGGVDRSPRPVAP